MEKNSLLKQIGTVLRHPFDFLRVAVSPPFWRESGTGMSEEKRKKIVIALETSFYLLVLLLGLAYYVGMPFWVLAIIYSAAFAILAALAVYSRHSDGSVLIIALRKGVSFLGWLRNHHQFYGIATFIVGVILVLLTLQIEIIYAMVGLAALMSMIWPPQRRCCSIEGD